jgi:hypothetical protein
MTPGDLMDIFCQTLAHFSDVSMESEPFALLTYSLYNLNLLMFDDGNAYLHTATMESIIVIL